MSRADWNQAPLREPIGVPTRLAARVLGGPVHAFVRVFHRATLEGTEHLPEGPYLLVGNHPPCIGGGEFACLMALWAKRFGATRPLAGFTHVAAHFVWPMTWAFAQIGAIPSTYGAAEQTLAKGVPIVLFPGGDHEAFHSFWQRTADFGGREGFLRIARKAGVPIVPLGITGESAPVLFRFRALAWLALWPRLTGVKRFGLTVLGALGALAILVFAPSPLWLRCVLAWAWAMSPLALVSWLPTTTRIRIGAPLPNTASRAEVEAAIGTLLR